MEFDLSPIEVRIVGSLLEKEVTTPEYYPLSLNALTLACNQKSNRDPVMSLTDETVVATLESLRGGDWWYSCMKPAVVLRSIASGSRRF